MAKSRLQTGSTIDGFLIGNKIAKGGMSMLWQVTRDDIQFPILMKVPIIFEGEDPAAIVSFEMEQMILPRLSGPHVPKFVAAGDFTAQPYIVMEQIYGKTLLSNLPNLPLDTSQVVSFAVAIAKALDDIHRQHVVHLDIKPSNVIFRETGEAVLIDYGLARHDQLPDLMEEEFRLPYGTAPYMAPEQILGIRSDPRSDLFALGSLMYFFCTGIRPFGDPQRLSGMKKRLWRDPVPPRKLRPDLSPWLQEIILRCLEVNPERRHPTAAQLAFDLQHPDQIEMTSRAQKLDQDGWSQVWRRRFNEDARPIRKKTLAKHLSGAPIVVVAVDFADTTPATFDALRDTVGRILQTTPGSRIACLNVLKLARLGFDQTLDKEGHNIHVMRLAQLRDWAAPLKLSDGKITYHVLEAISPAAAILEYASFNNVDHIIMGARANSRMKAVLGSVSGEVAAKAPCTVTVVRERTDRQRQPPSIEEEINQSKSSESDNIQ